MGKEYIGGYIPFHLFSAEMLSTYKDVLPLYFKIKATNTKNKDAQLSRTNQKSNLIQIISYNYRMINTECIWHMILAEEKSILR